MNKLVNTHHHWHTACHDLKLLARPNSGGNCHGVRYRVILLARSRPLDRICTWLLVRLRSTKDNRINTREQHMRRKFKREGVGGT